jgi:hypothetical protein
MRDEWQFAPFLDILCGYNDLAKFGTARHA